MEGSWPGQDICHVHTRTFTHYSIVSTTPYLVRSYYTRCQIAQYTVDNAIILSSLWRDLPSWLQSLCWGTQSRGRNQCHVCSGSHWICSGMAAGKKCSSPSAGQSSSLSQRAEQGLADLHCKSTTTASWTFFLQKNELSTSACGCFYAIRT